MAYSELSDLFPSFGESSPSPSLQILTPQPLSHVMHPVSLCLPVRSSTGTSFLPPNSASRLSVNTVMASYGVWKKLLFVKVCLFFCAVNKHSVLGGGGTEWEKSRDSRFPSCYLIRLEFNSREAGFTNFPSYFMDSAADRWSTVSTNPILFDLTWFVLYWFFLFGSRYELLVQISHDCRN